MRILKTTLPISSSKARTKTGLISLLPLSITSLDPITFPRMPTAAPGIADVAVCPGGDAGALEAVAVYPGDDAGVR